MIYGYTYEEKCKTVPPPVVPCRAVPLRAILRFSFYQISHTHSSSRNQVLT